MAEKNDDIVDLTEDEPGAAKGKKAKAPKAPKPPKEPAKKATDKKPEQKETADGKKKGGVGVIIIILILLILIGAFVFEEIQFNYLGARDLLISSVAKLDPDYKTYEVKFAELETREAELNKREASLDSRETSLDTRQTGLDTRKAELDAREISLTPIYQIPLTGQDLEDMQSLSKTYAQMDPATAADILSTLYDQQDMAAILYYMSERNRAPIMSEMDVKLAAALTEILLYK